MMPGERVLWEGHPAWRAVARDVVHVGWVASYFAVMLVWGAATDRARGLTSAETLLSAAPLFGAGLAVIAACAGFAYAVARTTRYVITTERCILHYGVALTATLSLPYGRIAAVGVAAREVGGDIKLTLKPGSPVRFLKVWPHVRPWRLRVAEPMLRGVPNAAEVASLLSHAVAQCAPGVLHAAPGVAAAPMPAAILSAAGD